MKKPSLLVVFLTVFVDLIGFGIVLPLMPVYSRQFGAPGWMMGGIIAAFSVMQFIFSPLWGAWSDRVGRRPALLISTLGSTISYSLFAVGSGWGGSAGLWLLLASRVFAGICGANITVAQAYIADITPPEKRSQRMGLIGMAFGLGFIFGPALGGISYSSFGITGPGWVAAALCGANFIAAFFILPESWHSGTEHAARRVGISQWRHTLSQPGVNWLVMLFFLSTFCFACFETTLGLLITNNFGLDIQHDSHAKTTVSYLFAYCGVIGALIQGGAIGRLVKKHGEARLIVLSLVLTGISLAFMPFIHGGEPLHLKTLTQNAGVPWIVMLLLLALLSIGTSLTRPPLFGLLSMLASSRDQGAVLGVAQSAGSLARIVAPIFAGSLFDIRQSFPYVICGAIALAAGLIAARVLDQVQTAAVGKTAAL